MGKIITLITDFRTSDGYMGAVFGVIKSINPEVDIITIASNIPPADIRKASRVLASSYPFYPCETVHMVVVDPTVGPERRALLISDNRYFFVGPDNGVFSPVLEAYPGCKCYNITSEKFRISFGSETFHGRDLLAPVASYLTLGIPLDQFGPEINDPIRIKCPEPERIGNDIIGKVIDIDSFGNLVTNIPSEIINKDVTVIVCGRTIKGLSRSYADVPEKQPLAYIGSSGYLEIAINKGNAANYFGVLIFEEIKIIGAGE